MSLFGDLNEVKILGNMTADPELRYTGNGTPVVNFSVATNRRFKQGEEWKDETEFHNVVVFGTLASNFAPRVHKGTRVMVVGRQKTRSWEGDDGKKNYRTEVIADDVFLIDRYEKGKNEDLQMPSATSESPAGNGGGNYNSENSSNSGYNPNSGNNSASSTPAASGNSKANDDVIDPDDLPF